MRAGFPGTSSQLNNMMLKMYLNVSPQSRSPWAAATSRGTCAGLDLPALCQLGHGMRSWGFSVIFLLAGLFLALLWVAPYSVALLPLPTAKMLGPGEEVEAGRVLGGCRWEGVGGGLP